MNILFFLTPKRDVVYVYNDDTLRQALEKMEKHRYTTVPVVSRRGKYMGTLTEGDLLWYIKNQLELDLRQAEHISLSEVPKHRYYEPVSASSRMEDLMERALNQNFVPVLDDGRSFIGIVTRKDILKYLKENK